MTALAIGMLLGLAAALFVAWPLVRNTASSRPAASDGQRERMELLVEKEHLLTALKEIDFDHEMGKLTDDDHQRLRADYRARAVALLKRLEGSASDAELEAAIEADVARVRAPSRDDAGEAIVSPPSGGGARFCAACGSGLGAGAGFCAACGSPVARAS